MNVGAGFSRPEDTGDNVILGRDNRGAITASLRSINILAWHAAPIRFIVASSENLSERLLVIFFLCAYNRIDFNDGEKPNG